MKRKEQIAANRFVMLDAALEYAKAGEFSKAFAMIEKAAPLLSDAHACGGHRLRIKLREVLAVTKAILAQWDKEIDEEMKSLASQRDPDFWHDVGRSLINKQKAARDAVRREP